MARGVFVSSTLCSLRVFRRMVGAAAPPVGPTILFYDTFTDTDDVALTAHTPDIDTVGGGWVNYQYAGIPGSHEIISNKTRALEATTIPVSAANVNVADCTIVDTIFTGSGAAPRVPLVAYRLVDQANFWFAQLGLAANTIIIIERTEESNVTRASEALVVDADETWTVTATLSGNDHSITAVSGAKSATVAYSSAVRNTATRHGIAEYTEGATIITHDNFTITE